MDNPYEYFVGRPVTIVTLASNLKYSPDSHANYAVGILESVDEWTCTTSHPVTGTKSIYRLEHVVAIHEEQQVNPEDPDDLKLLQEIEERREKFKKANPNLFEKAKVVAEDSPMEMPSSPFPSPMPPPPSVTIEEQPFVNVDHLQQLARMTKQRLKT